MASYYNYVTKFGKPAKAVLVRLCNKSGRIVDTAVTDQSGHYIFNNVPQGTYDIKYYGNRLTRSDWLYDVQIINADDIDSDGGGGTLSGLTTIAQIIPSDYYVRNTTGSIDMEAKLYENNEEVAVGDISNYVWLADGNNFGYSGPNQNTSTITADQISGITRVSCTLSYNSKDFTAYVGLTDILDGDDGDPGPTGPAGEGTYSVAMTSVSGIVFKSDDGTNFTPPRIDLITQLYKSNTEITDDNGAEYHWYLNNSPVLSGFGINYREYSVTPEMVSGVARVSCDVTYSGVNGPYTAEQTVTDISDGISYIPTIEYLGGQIFKVGSAGGASPSVIIMRGRLWKEGTLVPASDIYYYWYNQETSDLLTSGLGSSYQNYIADPDDVSGTSQTFTLTQKYMPTGKEFDVNGFLYEAEAPSPSFVHYITSTSGLTFKADSDGVYNPTGTDLTATIYRNVSDISENPLTYYYWYKDGSDLGLPDDTRTITVTPADVTDYAVYSCKIIYSGSDLTGGGGNLEGYGPFTSEVTINDIQDGVDALYVGISSNNGFAFVSGIDTNGYQPSDITLSGTLYLGGEVVTAPRDYAWTKDGVSVGSNSPTYTVNPEDITYSDRVECAITYPAGGSSTYYGEVTIFDVPDGAPGPVGQGAFGLSMTTNSGLVFKSTDGVNYNPSQIELTARFYESNVEITDNDSVEYHWYNGTTEVYSGFGIDYRTHTITPDDVSGVLRVACEVLYNGIYGPFVAEQTIVDVADGISYVPLLRFPEGMVFREGGGGGYSPSSLTANAVLYKEGSIAPSADIYYTWSGLDSDHILKEGQGTSNNFLDIQPAWISGVSKTFSVRQAHLDSGYNFDLLFDIQIIEEAEYPILTYISSTSGLTFRSNDGGTTYTPESTDLIANIYKGLTDVSDPVSYDTRFKWYKNNSILALPDDTRSITVTPADVDNFANYKCSITHSGLDIGGSTISYGPYTPEVTVQDIQDGVDAYYVGISSDSGFAFISGLSGYSPTDITLSGTLYLGGIPITDPRTYDWVKNDVTVSTDPTYTITPEDINRSERVECNITYPVGGTTYTNEITVFDVLDGQAGEDGDDGVAPTYLVPYVPSGTQFSYDGFTESSIKAFMYEGGIEISPTLVYYAWYIDEVLQPGVGSNQDTRLITASGVDYTAVVKCRANYNAVWYEFTLNFLDLTDGLDDYVIPVKVGSSDYTDHDVQISELTGHFGFTPIGRGELVVTGLTCTQGHIKTIGLEYAPNGGTNYKEIATYHVNIPSGTTYSKAFEFAGIPIESPNESTAGTYDFRTYVYNAFGTPGLIWDTSDWTDEYFEDLNIPFIGQNFFRQTVPKLEVSDDGRQTWKSLSPNERDITRLENSVVTLRWLDLATRNTTLTQGDLGDDYIEDWEGNDITSFSMSVDEMRSIDSYIILAKVYQDRGIDLTGTNTATGIPGDGPGTSSSSDNATWRVLKTIKAEQTGSYYTDNEYLYTKVALPHGRLLSLHVYMLVTYAPVDVIDGGGSKRKMIEDITEEEYPDNG